LRRTSGQDRRDRDRSHRREHHDRRWWSGSCSYWVTSSRSPATRQCSGTGTDPCDCVGKTNLSWRNSFCSFKITNVHLKIKRSLYTWRVNIPSVHLLRHLNGLQVTFLNSVQSMDAERKW